MDEAVLQEGADKICKVVSSAGVLVSVGISGDFQFAFTGLKTK
jgi:hypothetical protein